MILEIRCFAMHLGEGSQAHDGLPQLRLQAAPSMRLCTHARLAVLCKVRQKTQFFIVPGVSASLIHTECLG